KAFSAACSGVSSMLLGRHPKDDVQFVFTGSNAFALSGAHTANGAALLANDMHLALRVPNTWYRASLVWPSSAEASASATASADKSAGNPPDQLSTFNSSSSVALAKEDQP